MSKSTQSSLFNRYGLPILFVAALITGAFIVNFAAADPVASNADVASPAANGTADSANLSIPAQQYVGFYGNVTIQVRKTGGGPGTSLYNKSVVSGCVFVIDGSLSAPAWPAVVSPPDGNADGNFSLSGAYLTQYHYNTISGFTFCGVAGAFTLNTTDNFQSGIFRDYNGTNARHFVGSNIRDITSTNGFGRVQYEVIVPRTPAYGSTYDFFVDLG